MTEMQYTTEQEDNIESTYVKAKLGSHVATHIGMAFATGGMSLAVSVPTLVVMALSRFVRADFMGADSIGVSNDATVMTDTFQKKNEQSPYAKAVTRGMFEGALQFFTRPLGYAAMVGAVALDLAGYVLKLPQAAVTAVLPVKEKDQKIRKIFNPDHHFSLTQTAMQAFENGKVFSYVHDEKPHYKGAYQNRLFKKRRPEN